MPNDLWGGFTFGSTGSNSTNSPYPDRQLPSWMPTMDSMTRELQGEYGRVRSDFDTSQYDLASTRAEANTLTTGINAGNNAATAYANKVRQAGGSGLGAGLVKAESVVAGRKAAGDVALERARFDIQQREGAATQAASIASTLGELRNRYLASLVSYTTSEDATAAARSKAGGGGGDYQGLPFTVGTGLGRGSSDFNFSGWDAVQHYSDTHQHGGSIYLGLGQQGGGGGGGQSFG